MSGDDSEKGLTDPTDVAPEIFELRGLRVNCQSCQWEAERSSPTLSRRRQKVSRRFRTLNSWIVI